MLSTKNFMFKSIQYDVIWLYIMHVSMSKFNSILNQCDAE